jgi:hypothetical protein
MGRAGVRADLSHPVLRDGFLIKTKNQKSMEDPKANHPNRPVAIGHLVGYDFGTS